MRSPVWGVLNLRCLLDVQVEILSIHVNLVFLGRPRPELLP